jgi:hypothetical protein
MRVSANFRGALDASLSKAVRKALKSLSLEQDLIRAKWTLGRKPGGHGCSTDKICSGEAFWIKTGSLEPVDWSEVSPSGRSCFYFNPVDGNELKRLARAVAAGP